jgi:Tol biopolymer transport system component
MPTQLITFGTSGAADANSWLPAGDGVFDTSGNLIVFATDATNLTTNDNNGVRDVYIYNRTSNTYTYLTRVTQGNVLTTLPSDNPVISGNGQTVILESAQNLNGGTAFRDIYRVTNLAGTPPTFTLLTNGYNGSSFNASISADGNWAVFETESNTNTDVGAIDGADRDIILYNLTTNAQIWVSQITGGGGNAPGFANSTNASVSQDGRFVVFQSTQQASDFIPVGVNDPNGAASDIFLFDRTANSLTLVSRSTAGGINAGNGASSNPMISADGQFVVYESLASNLVAGDTNGVRDIFRYEIATNQTQRINLRTGGAQTIANSFSPAINSDGSYIAFASDDVGLVTGDNNGVRDVFRWNNGTIVRVSVDSSGGEANNASTNPAISADGRLVTFESLATDLGTPVQAGVRNLFVYSDAPTPPPPPPGDPLTNPVYRFYNPISRGHFFTIDPSERDTVLANPQWQYNFEGVGFEAGQVGQ